MGVYNDPNLQAYVSGIGMRLAMVSERPTLPWHYTVVDSPAINAFALPGGYIYITRGILPFLNDEAQLAGVLGHETGHVTARHAAQQYTRAVGGTIGPGRARHLRARRGAVRRLAEQGLGVLFLKYSREDELQADQLGVRYAVARRLGSGRRSRHAGDARPPRRGVRADQGHPELARDASAEPLARVKEIQAAVQQARGRAHGLRARSASATPRRRRHHLRRQPGAGDRPRQPLSFTAPAVRDRLPERLGHSERPGARSSRRRRAADVYMLLEQVRAPAGTASRTSRIIRCRTPASAIDGAPHDRSTASTRIIGMYQGSLQDLGRVQMRVAAHRARTATSISSPASRR